MSKAMEPAASDSLAPLDLDARSPRASGFVTQGTTSHHGRSSSAEGVEDVIRQANAELQNRSGESLTLPLAIAVEQRDAAYQQLQLERQAWQAQHNNLVSNHSAQLLERETTLDNLRQQLRDAERELAFLREDPKTVIGVGPVSTRMASPQAHDSGEHRLQTSLESAWEDVQDLRTRLSQVELERDDATREADDLRIEVYSKLAAVRDEVIELEARLDESQRALLERDEALTAARGRFAAENEEIRQALHAQIQGNIELRRAITSGLSPAAYASTDLRDTAITSHIGASTSLPPVQTSAALFEEGDANLAQGSNGPPASAQPALWTTSFDSEGFGVSEAPAPTFASLVGFETSPPDAGDAALEAASALDQELQELHRRSRGFGLSRLFQRTK